MLIHDRAGSRLWVSTHSGVRGKYIGKESKAFRNVLAARAAKDL